MALKPTIYKAQVALADMDRQHYEDLALTLACHPSETLERMAVRLLAYCLHAAPGLDFGRGLSSTEEPALSRVEDNGEVALWIDVGQPEAGRLRKACGRAGAVVVYAFGRSAGTWWKQNGEELAALPKLEVWQLEWPEVEALARLFGRTSQLSVSVTGGVIYVDNGTDSVSLEPVALQRAS